ncbi:hypothetical protein F2Q69_00059097 [Brassica cretica]|uniref:Uncharacterized protein n=1 Tax=Brassica cretica TaxID=69181 RepID=A0A8S9RJ39_BRACR|nr:hypothetical protein F2Q69_00059097 [Brassica cretica]
MSVLLKSGQSASREEAVEKRNLLKWALEPAEDEVLDRLFELGYADAATWSEMSPVDELEYQQHTRPSIDIGDPTSIDRCPEFEKEPMTMMELGDSTRISMESIEMIMDMPEM